MHTQSEFYSREFFSGANFWATGDTSTRRTFLLPLANPGELLATANGRSLPSTRGRCFG